MLIRLVWPIELRLPPADEEDESKSYEHLWCLKIRPSTYLRQSAQKECPHGSSTGLAAHFPRQIASVHLHRAGGTRCTGSCKMLGCRVDAPLLHLCCDFLGCHPRRGHSREREAVGDPPFLHSTLFRSSFLLKERLRVKYAASSSFRKFCEDTCVHPKLTIAARVQEQGAGGVSARNPPFILHRRGIGSRRDRDRW